MPADDLPTPAYVYDLDVIRRARAALAGFLPQPSTLYYSLKANPHPLIAATLREAGCAAEVCSPGELDVAIEAGFTDILYTGPGKRDADVAGALKAGVRAFSVDSPHGIAQLRTIAADHDVEPTIVLRVNPDRPAPGQRLAMTGVASQFGADAAWIDEEPHRFAGVHGFHLYMGTNSAGEDDLMVQFAQSIQVAERLRDRLGIEVAVLDLGGGFGAPYARAGVLPRFDTLAERIAERLDVAFPGWRAGAPTVAFESGRYLTATAGHLRTRVLDVKRSHGREVVVCESGINHLGGMSGLRRVPQIAPDIAAVRGPSDAPADVPSDEVRETMLVGPLCTPLDVWHGRAELPALRPGDVVEIPNVGAYGLTASLLAFLSHPPPAEIILDGGRVREISTMRATRHRACAHGED